MKLPLSIEVSDAGYGDHCDACKCVTYTTSIVIKYRDQVFRQSLLCPKCIESGVDIDLNLELGADPERRKEAKQRIKQSRELEQVLADDMGGRVQPGSGSTRLPGFKGDVRVMGQWRVEHKYTKSLSRFPLKLVDIAKIIGHAMEANELPALIIEFVKARQSVAVIPFSLFLEMIHAYENDQRPAKGKQKRSR